MKKVNLPLILGSIIVCILIFIMIFPHIFTDVNPYAFQGVKSVINESGIEEIRSAPFAPREGSILGTDQIGRDVFSLLIYGTRLTITLSLLIVLARFMVAVPIGIAAGFGNNVLKGLIRLFNLIFSAVPALLFSVIILKMNYFLDLFKVQSIIAFIAVLTFVGWGKLASIIMERVQEILTKPFIKGEIAIGKSKFKIAIQNVLSHLSTELIVLFFMEVALVLTMIMQLGVLGCYVGNLRVIEDTAGGVIKTMDISFEPEWASMLATSRSYLTTAPWMIISPAIAFFISILGFNFVGEGLRAKRKILFNKKVPQNKLSKKYFTKWITPIVLGCICLIALISVNFNGNSIECFNYKDSFGGVYDKLSDEIIIGSEDSFNAAEYIQKAFNDMGVKPIDDKGFIREYTIEDLYFCNSSKLEINNGGNKIELVKDKDYALESFGNIKCTGEVYNASKDDMFNFNDYNILENKFVLLDSSLYSFNTIKDFSKKILTNSHAKGIICIMSDGEEVEASIGHDTYDGAVIYVNRKYVDYFKDGTIIDLNIECKKMQNLGRNVIAKLDGEDSETAKETIIIGIGYNYFSKDSEIGKKRILMGLDIMKRLAENKEKNRTIILAFWDGNVYDETNGMFSFINNKEYSPKDSILYLDLTDINAEKFNSVSYDDKQAPITRYFAWSFNYEISSRLRKNEISLIPCNSMNEDDIKALAKDTHKAMYIKRGTPTIVIGTEKYNNENGKFDINLLEQIIIESIEKINY